MNIEDIDFGEDTQSIPLENRKSISILLGAGFSVPMGYPTGRKLNQSLLNFDDNKCSIEPNTGVLVTTIDGSKPIIENNGNQKYFDL